MLPGKDLCSSTQAMAAPASNINNPSKEETTVLSRWLNKLKRLGFGDARDDLLVAAGAVYGVGYIVWALHASRYNLGLLPALESQYFIAGLAPAVVILIAYKLTVLGELGLAWIRRRLGDPETALERLLNKTINTLFVGSLLFAIAGGFLSKPFPRFSERVQQVGIWIFIGSFFFLPDSGEDNAPPKKLSPDYISYWFFRGYRLLMLRYLGVSIAVLGIIFYAEKVHSVFPQELGGGSPRCASLDLMKSSLSDQTLKALFAEDGSGKENQAAHSVDVDVFFAGSDYFLVKPRGRSADDRTTYEIRRDAVQSVTWCK